MHGNEVSAAETEASGEVPLRMGTRRKHVLSCRQCYVRFNTCLFLSVAYLVCCLQVQGIENDTDSIGEVVERNMDLLQAFVKSLLMVCQGTSI